MKTLISPLKATAAVAAFALATLSSPALAGKPKWAEKSDATIVEFAIDAGSAFYADALASE